MIQFFLLQLGLPFFSLWFSFGVYFRMCQFYIWNNVTICFWPSLVHKVPRFSVIRTTPEEHGSQGCTGHSSSFTVHSLLANWAPFFFFLIRDQLLHKWNIFFRKMVIPPNTPLAVETSNQKPDVCSIPQALNSTRAATRNKGASLCQQSLTRHGLAGAGVEGSGCGTSRCPTTLLSGLSNATTTCQPSGALLPASCLSTGTYSSCLSKTLCPSISISPFPPPLQSLATTILLFDSMNLTILNTWYNGIA